MEVREFTRAHLPDEIREKVTAGEPLTRADHMRWQDILAKKGWLVGFWPRQHGGQGWTPLESYLFQEETSRYGAPTLIPMGINYVGPVIYTFGSEDQKRTHLPGIAANTTFWCQGYSEPNAGSDLAQLQTRAERRGDEYVVNGSKIWTSFANWADWIFALVRTSTDSKPQNGISFLLIDLRSKGVSIQPITSIDGERHLNQVFFEDVHVPVTNRVGEENRGWTYAKFLLGHERVLAAEVGKAKRLLERLRQLAAQRSRTADPRFLDCFAQLEVEVMALEYTTVRFLGKVMAGGEAGADSSLLKLRGSSVLQKITESTVDLIGTDAVRSNGLVGEFLYHRAHTIWAGSNEVQRNILAKQVLGL